MNTIGNKKHNKFSRKWINKTGVFKIPNGEYIVRVPQAGKPPTTIRKTKTRAEAKKLFEDFISKNKR